MIENSIPFELHHVQDPLNFKTNEETLGFHTILLSDIIPIVPFLDPTLEIDSMFEKKLLHISFHQDHVLDLPLHLEALLIICNQIPLKVETVSLKAFQSQKPNMNVCCVPLK